MEILGQLQEISISQGDVLRRDDFAILLTNTDPSSVDRTVFLADQMSSVGPDINDEEKLQARIERLGRARPEKFKTMWAEIGFVFSISMSQVLTEYFLSGFALLLPTIANDLELSQEARTWPASAFSLVIASFLLVFGRLADMYGGYLIYVAGMAWLALWSLIAGFSTNALMLDICRALQGLGPAAFLPSSMMLLGSIYRPGPRKNLVFSIYGACAALGFFVGGGGVFFANLAGQHMSQGTYFWIGTALAVITAVVAWMTIPSDMKEAQSMGVKMDWLGALLSISGLVLFSFAIIESSHAPQQWKTAYIYVPFIFGSLLLISAAYVEYFVASEPLLPVWLFKVPNMSALIAALIFCYGSFGIFIVYATFYMEQVMGASSLLVVAWYVPMALGGCIVGAFGGLVLHMLPGTVLVLVAGVAWIIAPLLFAIAPDNANYWAYVFPSMICATIGIDTTFNVSNIFITSSFPRKQQGLAGSIIMILLHLGIAIFIGFADIVNTYTIDTLGEKRSYQAVFWFEVACASMSLLILFFFVEIKRAESGLTVDEIAEMQREEERNTTAEDEKKVAKIPVGPELEAARRETI